jgi:hypothetical protein
MENYIVKKFWEFFSDYSSVYDFLAQSIFKNRDLIMKKSEVKDSEMERIVTILHFLIKSDLFSLFMDTYANELHFWLLDQLQKLDNEDMNLVLTLYKESIHLESDFWKMLNLKEDWRLGEQTIHKLFLISKRDYTPPLSVQKILPIIKLQDFRLVCSGFNNTLNLELLEKEIIIFFSRKIKQNQNFEILFEVFLWAQFIGSKLGISDKEVTQRIFEGLEVILDNHFHFFELYIIPMMYEEIINKGEWNENIDKKNNSPNHFNYLNSGQIEKFDNMKMEDLVPLLNDTQVGNFRFWFLIKMIYLVSDKTQLFNDFYAFYFERKLRGIQM